MDYCLEGFGLEKVLVTVHLETDIRLIMFWSIQFCLITLATNSFLNDGSSLRKVSRPGNWWNVTRIHIREWKKWLKSTDSHQLLEPLRWEAVQCFSSLCLSGTNSQWTSTFTYVDGDNNKRVCVTVQTNWVPDLPGTWISRLFLQTIHGSNHGVIQEP